MLNALGAAGALGEGNATGRTHILHVEDDPYIAAILKEVLEDSGYRVTHAETGGAAKAVVESDPPDLVVLDLMLPDTDGLVLCADLHTRCSAPIIICSATHEKRDAILGFKLGADDFVPKPFDIEQLVARIEASLRRAAIRHEAEGTAAVSMAAAAPAKDGATAPTGRASFPGAGVGMGAPSSGYSDASAGAQGRVERAGTLTIDHARRMVTVGGHQVAVTPTEYRILCALAARPDEVVGRDELALKVWGFQDAGIGRSLDVHMRRLRVKLQSGPATPPSIVSVRGFGYKLVPDEELAALSA